MTYVDPITEQQAHDLASHFVAIVNKYTRGKIHTITMDNVAALQKIMCAIFLDAATVIPREDRPDFVGLTDTTYFDVIDEDGVRHEAASTWLAVRLNDFRSTRNPSLTHEKFVAQVAKEWILDRIPMSPIVVTVHGAEFTEYADEGTTAHLAESTPLDFSLLCHRYCRGRLARRRYARSLDSVTCECGLQLLTSRENKTIAELRRSCEKQIASDRAAPHHDRCAK